MKQFSSKYIATEHHHLLGVQWPFRYCFVEMVPAGFVCNCQKNPREKCNHIKSVELGILGVNQPRYKF